MTGIVGIGGVFFKSDVKATQDWYARVLGVRFSDWGSAEFPSASAGQTVLGPFSADTDYFAPSTQPFMINLLVEDMDGMIARIETAGVQLLGRQDESYGRFIWLMDPNGIKLELWEPVGEGEPPA
jgi:predicted enzyme related to lactoylglutathione lyase